MKKTILYMLKLTAITLVISGAGCTDKEMVNINSVETNINNVVTNNATDNTTNTVKNTIQTQDVIAKINEPFQLKLNQTALIEEADLEIKLTNINDSRCPVDVQCLVAGEVTLTLVITQNGQVISNNLTVKTNGVETGAAVALPQTIGNYQVVASTVVPTTNSVPPETSNNYSVTFEVKK